MSGFTTDGEGVGVASSYATPEAQAPSPSQDSPVALQSARNQFNAERQARADELVQGVKNGLKIAAVQANPDALPATRALAERLVTSRDGEPVLRDLPGYLDQFA